MIDEGLVHLLACPICGYSPLELKATAGGPENILEGQLICSQGTHEFPILHGLPVLLPEGVGPDLRVRAERWRPWRDHLGKFMEWREAKYGRGYQNRRTVPSPDHISFQQDFLQFGGLRQSTAGGSVLDVGCAAGEVRTWLGGGWRYYGVDPLPIHAWFEFPMAQAMGEQLPFRRGVFEAVLIMQTLDHSASPAQLLSEARRVLAPGGTLVIQQVVRPPEVSSGARRFDNPLRRLFENRRLNSAATKTHRFTQADLQALVAVNFDIAEARMALADQMFVRALAAP